MYWSIENLVLVLTLPILAGGYKNMAIAWHSTPLVFEHCLATSEEHSLRSARWAADEF